MNIRPASDADWTAICRLGFQFYEDGTLRGEFTPSVFIHSWKQMIGAGFGHVYVQENNSDLLIGTIGGFITPDPCNGELVATEAFWFVDKTSRGRGLALLDYWVQVAQNAGCKRLTMVALCNSYLDRMTRLYQRKGFTPVETHFMRDL